MPGRSQLEADAAWIGDPDGRDNPSARASLDRAPYLALYPRPPTGSDIRVNDLLWGSRPITLRSVVVCDHTFLVEVLVSLSGALLAGVEPLRLQRLLALLSAITTKLDHLSVGQEAPRKAA